MEPELRIYPSLDSTNLESARLISDGTARDSMFVVSDYQDHGKGQGENIWISNRNENLLLSWIVFPAFLSVNLQFQLSKAVSLAITDLLQDYKIHSEIKWPNDILSDNMKIAGVLIENSLIGNAIKHSVIGIGLNINQLVFPPFPYAATSIRALTGKQVLISEIRNAIMTKLEFRYEQLKSGLMEIIDEEYLQKLFRLHKRSDFSVGPRQFSGKIIGVDEHGEILVEEASGISKYGFHEIKQII